MAKVLEDVITEDIITDYIAHQVRHPYAPDEIMALVKAFEKGENVGLCGPPGVGKTLMVYTAAKLMGREIESITCVPDTTVTDIVGGYVPKIKEGALGFELELKKGPLARAMEEGKIFYADEYNKLERSIQSYLSAPLDFRKELRAKDGTLLVREAHKNFAFVASWNPGEEYGGEEIIGYIKDRISYMPFSTLPIDLQTRIVLLKSGNLNIEDIKDDKIQERAIANIDGKFVCMIRMGDYFVDIHNKKRKLKADDKRLRRYLCYVGKEGDKLELKDKKKQETYENFYNLASFVRDCRNIILYGSKGIREELKNVLSAFNLGDLEPLHEIYHIEPRSIRVIEPLAKKYKELLENIEEGGLSPEEMVEELAEDLIYNLIQDKENVEISPNITWGQLVRKIGELYHMKIKDETYQLIKEKGFAEMPEE